MLLLSHEGKLNAGINAAECWSGNRSNCVEIYVDERTDNGHVFLGGEG